MKELLLKNQQWASEKLERDACYFKNLSLGQSPKYLWIGCSDSRVCPEVLCKLEPAELLVVRNPANLCSQGDSGLQAALELAIDKLKIEEIIVCGHTECAGVSQAFCQPQDTSMSGWVDSIRGLAKQHKQALDNLSPSDQCRYLEKYNVIEQVFKLSQSKSVQNAWQEKRSVTVHGVIFNVSKGLIEDLGCSIQSTHDAKELQAKYL